MGLTSIEIPNSVIEIGSCAFAQCLELASVTIGESVTTIGAGAFSIDSNLSVVNFNAGNCTIMGNGINNNGKVFSLCSSFTTLNIGENVKNIPNYAFSECSGLTSVTIPDSVTNIGDSAFYNCTGIEELTIGNSVANISNSAFVNCRNLHTLNYNARNCTNNDCWSALYGITALSTLNIGNSVVNISAEAFSGCNRLTSLTIGNSVESIGEDAFSLPNLPFVYYNGNIEQWCGIAFGNNYSNPIYQSHNLYVDNELITNLIIPETVAEIKNYAFVRATCLETVEIGSSVASIGNYAFSECGSLTGDLIIPNSVISIGESAFNRCNGLATITIGSAVTSIGSSAFVGCSDIDTIFSYSPDPPAITLNTFDLNVSGVPVIVPCERVSTYSSAPYWRRFSNIQQSPDCAGVEENEIADLQIFPNPVGNILNITSSEEISSVEIVNTLGQVVLQMDVDGESAVCDVENLPSGVYVVKVRALRQAQGATLRKFVKE